MLSTIYVLGLFVFCHSLTLKCRPIVAESLEHSHFTWSKPCMMTSPSGNIVRVTGHLWGEFTGHRWIPLTKASDTVVDVFFDLRQNTRWSKHSRRRWFETLSRSLWRHFNDGCWYRTPATQGAIATAVMVWTYLSRNIPVTPLLMLILWKLFLLPSLSLSSQLS